MTTPSVGDSNRSAFRGRLVRGIDAVSNPASLKGAFAVLGGSIIILTPSVTTTVVQVIVVVGALLTAGIELGYAVSGRSRIAVKRSRWWSAARGMVALLLAFVLVVLDVAGSRVGLDGGALGLALVVALAGVYVAVRGVIVVIGAWRDRSATYRGVRLTGGAAGIAFGTLAATVPSIVSETLIVGIAVVAIVLGMVLVMWGLRRTEYPAAAESGAELDPATATIPEVLWDWIRGADIGYEQRRELADGLYFEQPERSAKRLAWWTMLVLSVAIATYAVLADSTAVVIGAMLVAPLMVPILGLAGAIVNGWRWRAIESALLVTLGVAVSIGLSFGLSSWAPVAIAFETNTQITSRVTPTLVDMLIAVAAGAAGAFATVDKRVSSSIAGVAIAVALVPPLAVVGICLGGGRGEDALGALLLFVTNFVAIVLSAAAVFVLTGFARPSSLRDNAQDILSTVIPFVALASVVLVPLLFNSEGLLDSASQQTAAQDAVDEWLGEDSGLVVESITSDGDRVIVSLLGSGQAPPLEDLQRALKEPGVPPPAVELRVTPVEVETIEAP